MTGPLTLRRWGSAVLVAAALAGIGISDAALRPLEAGRGASHHLLYLPNGRYLRLAALGNAPLLADVIYLWSIQYYANYQIADRYAYVEHVYSGIITELDPHYFDPYWLGALILSVEAGSLDKALALLDKGFANNPEKWIFPYLAGWECSTAKRYDRAIGYFKQAAAVPSAPPDVQRLVAGMYQKAGDAQTALAEWKRIERETKDPSVRKVAENRVNALTVDLDLERLRGAIERYRVERGAAPVRLEDLVRARVLSVLPEPPGGGEYGYDPRTGAVTAGPARVITR